MVNYLNKLVIFIIIILLGFSTNAKEELLYETNYISLHNTLFNVIIDNVKLEIINSDYSDISEFRAYECGVIQICDETINLSYSSDYWINISLALPYHGFLYIKTLENGEIEEFESITANVYNNSGASEYLLYEEWEYLYFACMTYQFYTWYVERCLTDNTWNSDIDLEFILNNMEVIWGIKIINKYDLDLEIECTRIQDSWTDLHFIGTSNGIEISSWDQNINTRYLEEYDSSLVISLN